MDDMKAPQEWNASILAFGCGLYYNVGHRPLPLHISKRDMGQIKTYTSVTSIIFLVVINFLNVAVLFFSDGIV